MKRTTCKRVVAGLALLACLSLYAPIAAHATALPGTGNHAGWSAGIGWLSSFWDVLKIMLAGGGAAGTPVAKDGAAPTVAPGPPPGGGAQMDDTSQINPDGHT